MLAVSKTIPIRIANADSTRDGRTHTDIAIDISATDYGRRNYRERVVRKNDPARRFRCQALAKISVPLVPPKPNEFLTAILIDMSRAVLAQ